MTNNPQLFAVLCATLPLIASAAFADSRQPQADFYVSPAGLDSWSGKLPVPSANGADGPFATLQRAQLAARQLRASHPDAPVTVLIREGLYSLDSPITFTPEDSGTAPAPTTYAAYPGESPVFTGGTQISGWHPTETELWAAEIPRVEAGEWYFHQLFINGRRAIRARTPNDGYFHIAAPLKPLDDRTAARNDTSTKMGFRFTPGDVPELADYADANIIDYHSWTSSLHFIDRVDNDSHSLHYSNQSAWPVGYWDEHERYHIENYFEALDSPGEWYLDRSSGMCYYWPLPGEDMPSAEVFAPRIQKLVQIDGDAAAGHTVNHLTISGLAFRHAEWLNSRTNMADGQAHTHLSSAFTATGAHNCLIEECEIAHVGEYALTLGEGCQNNTIRTCHIHDMGGGGVRLGQTSLPAEPERRAEHNTVDNSFIHDGGHVFRGSIGVWIGRSSYNTVSHNEICDFFYSGCSVGWNWGYSPSTANHNIFEYNHIHHLGKGVLSDMGGIYSLGKSPGTIERNNLIHDVQSYSYGGWGLYTDEGSSEILLENNIVYNCKTGCFHQHYGRMNTLRNNIFAFSNTGVIVRSRVEAHTSFLFKRNIVLTNHSDILAGNWGDNAFRMDHNIYWDINGAEPLFNGLSFQEWRALGHDVHSRVMDPGFVDARNFDFRFKPDAPALKFSFKPINIDEVGLYGDRKWVQLPKSIQSPPSALPPIPAPPKAVYDFEDRKVGDKATFATTLEEAPATIRVTDEIACTGKHSLKFTDAPGLTQSWMPHLSSNLTYTHGIVTTSFDVLLRENAIFWHEWRQTPNPYLIGPSLKIDASGQLSAGGQILTTVPRDEWIHIDITAPLGQAAGTWKLAVKVGDGKTQHFTDLPNVNPEWSQLRWMVTVSLATTNAVFYLDNVKIAHMKP